MFELFKPNRLVFQSLEGPHEDASQRDGAPEAEETAEKIPLTPEEEQALVDEAIKLLTENPPVLDVDGKQVQLPESDYTPLIKDSVKKAVEKVKDDKESIHIVDLMVDAEKEAEKFLTVKEDRKREDFASAQINIVPNSLSIKIGGTKIDLPSGTDIRVMKHTEAFIRDALAIEMKGSGKTELTPEEIQAFVNKSTESINKFIKEDLAKLKNLQDLSKQKLNFDRFTSGDINDTMMKLSGNISFALRYPQEFKNSPAQKRDYARKELILSLEGRFLRALGVEKFMKGSTIIPPSLYALAKEEISKITDEDLGELENSSNRIKIETEKLQQAFKDYVKLNKVHPEETAREGSDKDDIESKSDKWNIPKTTEYLPRDFSSKLSNKMASKGYKDDTRVDFNLEKTKDGVTATAVLDGKKYTGKSENGDPEEAYQKLLEGIGGNTLSQIEKKRMGKIIESSSEWNFTNVDSLDFQEAKLQLARAMAETDCYEKAPVSVSVENSKGLKFVVIKIGDKEYKADEGSADEMSAFEETLKKIAGQSPEIPGLASPNIPVAASSDKPPRPGKSPAQTPSEDQVSIELSKDEQKIFDALNKSDSQSFKNARDLNNEVSKKQLAQTMEKKGYDKDTGVSVSLETSGSLKIVTIVLDGKMSVGNGISEKVAFENALNSVEENTKESSDKMAKYKKMIEASKSWRFDQAIEFKKPGSIQSLARVMVEKGYNENTKVVVQEVQSGKKFTTRIVLDGKVFTSNEYLSAHLSFNSALEKVAQNNIDSKLKQKMDKMLDNDKSWNIQVSELEYPQFKQQLARVMVENKYDENTDILITSGIENEKYPYVEVVLNGVPFKGRSPRPGDIIGAFKDALTQIKEDKTSPDIRDKMDKILKTTNDWNVDYKLAADHPKFKQDLARVMAEKGYDGKKGVRITSEVEKSGATSVGIILGDVSFKGVGEDMAGAFKGVLSNLKEGKENKDTKEAKATEAIPAPEIKESIPVEAVSTVKAEVQGRTEQSSDKKDSSQKMPASGTEAIEEVEREWQQLTPARDSEKRLYRVMKKDDFVVYVHDFNKLVYSREGNVIGFQGEDNKLHFHDPVNGWGNKDVSNVGIIKHYSEGLNGIPDFSKFKTPETKVDLVRAVQQAEPLKEIKKEVSVKSDTTSLPTEKFKEATKNLPQEVSQVLAEALTKKGYGPNTKITIDIDNSNNLMSITLDGVTYDIPYYDNSSSPSEGLRARRVEDLMVHFDKIKTQEDNRLYREEIDNFNKSKQDINPGPVSKQSSLGSQVETSVEAKKNDAISVKVNALEIFKSQELSAEKENLQAELTKVLTEKGYDKNTMISVRMTDFKGKKGVAKLIEIALDGISYRRREKTPAVAFRGVIEAIKASPSPLRLNEEQRRDLSDIQSKISFSKTAAELNQPFFTEQIARKMVDLNLTPSDITVNVTEDKQADSYKVEISISGIKFKGDQPIKYKHLAFTDALRGITRDKILNPADE